MILEMFSDYLPFINIVIVILLNILLIILKPHWIYWIVANVMILLVMQLIGLQSFDLLTMVADVIIDFVINIVVGIFDRIFEAIGDLVESITSCS